MTENRQAFKEFLKAEFDKRDWKQADVVREARRIDPSTNLGKATVSRWLDEADPTPPDLESLMLLSRLLGTSLETILLKLYPGQFHVARLTGLSADARLIAEHFDKFPEYIQKAILVLMREAVE